MKRSVHNTMNGLYKVLAGLVIILLSTTACDEDEFLKETPLDFFSPSSSFTTMEQYESAINQFYSRYREGFWGSSSQSNGILSQQFVGTDLTMNARGISTGVSDFESVWASTASRVSNLWNECYRMIFDANVIIGRVAGDNVLTEAQRTAVDAEAKFFRALAYKMLANTFGGVPLFLEETTSAKRDFVRDTRNAVYEQCAMDLEDAVAGLADISNVEDHRISKEVANHFLSEVYISLQRWPDAIAAATAVIDHPSTGLMTSRFGARVSDPGDVYWDLFRQDNQNRSSGNNEALWVLQFEHLVEGGGDRQYILERLFGPRVWRADILDTDGEERNLLSGGPNTYYTGRSSGMLRTTPFFYGELWDRSGAGDIRNSVHNIIRDFKVNNPDSPSNGLFADANGLTIKKTYEDTAINFYPGVAKWFTPGKHPADLWASNQSIPGALISGARQTWRNHYAARLADTYLLRAEAHLGNGNTTLAAADINVVRSRSEASDVLPADVDIDYILDERLRELHFEVFRGMTLRRLNRIDRGKTYNPVFGATIQDHHNLWPIPFSEIELNTEAALEQNPGYSF